MPVKAKRIQRKNIKSYDSYANKRGKGVIVDAKKVNCFYSINGCQRIKPVKIKNNNNNYILQPEASNDEISHQYIDQEEKDIEKTIKFLDWYLQQKQ